MAGLELDVLPAVNDGFLLRGSRRAPVGSCFTGNCQGVPWSYVAFAASGGGAPPSITRQ